MIKIIKKKLEGFHAGFYAAWLCSAPCSGADKGTTNATVIRDAILYGLSIVIIYVGLGLLVTLIFGASALNALSTNAVVNIIFFLILVLFAIALILVRPKRQKRCT